MTANTTFEAKLIRQGGTALADQLVVSGTTFATGIIVGRTCSKEDFGLFMLAFSVVLFCNGVLLSLISTPYMVRRPHLTRAVLERYNGNTLAYLAVLCGIASLCSMLATAAALLGLGPSGASSVAAVLSAVIVVQLFREYARQVCIAGMHMSAALEIDLTVALIQLGGLLVLAATDRLTPSSAFVVIGLACGLSSLVWWMNNRRSFPIGVRRAVLEIGEHWHLARFTFSGGLLHALTINLYPWIVAWAGGTSAAGVWAACLAVAGLVNPFIVGVENYLAPRLAESLVRGGRSLLRGLAVRSAAGFSASILPYVAILGLFGGSAVVLLYGDKYANHGQLVTVLGAALLTAGAGFSFTRALFSIDRADVDVLSNAFALICLLTAGAWMAWQWGPLGAAWAMLIINVATSSIRAAAFLWLVRPLPMDALP